MKNLVFLFVSAILLSVTACKNIDKELVGKMQSDLTTMEGLTGPMEELSTTVNNMVTQIQSAPDELKRSDHAEYRALLEQSAMILNKQYANQEAYNDMLGKLKTLMADYSAGKIKTEDAKKEYETLGRSVESFANLPEQMRGVCDQMQMTFAKITADWNAKTEAAAK